ncbi:toll/interleukin-1 receptor domain-containing protein [Chryseobacterium luquanense]|uniref:Toll/interleukin-1 receptor domain-containing protein n=1 Tax=Chryseobacterium luquanense TaxID=2983766 RepID=A0ABT3Y1Y8_9FLAO|nr:toll/interleukin-1 receptor domain-containing protein [Chryseobacterium luquanense]MCX8532167.1 toll/interleukin-1 receptor domain-containing protein [Chryseobacterium luquanense]
MKPKIFLSHSKKDKVIIEQIANDLRKCGIEVWYDEWEIPVGESIRKKIFDDGIPNCDVFFIYLTKNSLESYWVQKELDSAIFREAEEKNNILTIFVDQDLTRDSISYDLKSLSIPIFNKDEYVIPFAKLASKAWQSHGKKVANNNLIKIQKEKFDLEQEKFELEKNIFHINKLGLIDLNKIETLLKANFTQMRNGITVSFFEAFTQLKYKLAIGSTMAHLEHILDKTVTVDIDTPWGASIDYSLDVLIGELILQGMVKAVLPSSENGEYYILTDTGINFVKRL